MTCSSAYVVGKVSRQPFAEYCSPRSAVQILIFALIAGGQLLLWASTSLA
jgi:hypothetical protein